VTKARPFFLRDLRGSILRGLRVKPALFGSREGREGAKTAKGKSFAIAVIASTLLCQATFAPAEESNTSDDIVVIARKLNATRFVWKANDDSGRWRLKYCKIKKSSGDKEIDALTCKATETCIGTMPIGIKAFPTSFAQCLTETRSDLVAELADRRAMKK
jgi:hypothetical protein